MRFTASLLSTSIDSRSTATYSVNFETASIFIDVHPSGRHSNTNFTPETAKIIARELTARYVSANGWWPTLHSFEVK